MVYLFPLCCGCLFYMRISCIISARSVCQRQELVFCHCHPTGA
jgi:hypothetical protein